MLVLVLVSCGGITTFEACNIDLKNLIIMETYTNIVIAGGVISAAACLVMLIFLVRQLCREARIKKKYDNDDVVEVVEMRYALNEEQDFFLSKILVPCTFLLLAYLAILLPYAMLVIAAR
jgi:hypothetical protein